MFFSLQAVPQLRGCQNDSPEPRNSVSPSGPGTPTKGFPRGSGDPQHHTFPSAGHRVGVEGSQEASAPQVSRKLSPAQVTVTPFSGLSNGRPPMFHLRTRRE